MTTEQMTPDEAKRVLEEEQKQRGEACKAEIDAVLAKYNCQLAAPISVVEGRVVASIVVVANAA